MRAAHVLLSLAAGFLLACGTPLKAPQKTVSLPLHRPFSVSPLPQDVREVRRDGDSLPVADDRTTLSEDLVQKSVRVCRPRFSALSSSFISVH